jgi:hypothetical protein
LGFGGWVEYDGIAAVFTPATAACCGTSRVLSYSEELYEFKEESVIYRDDEDIGEASLQESESDISMSDSDFSSLDVSAWHRALAGRSSTSELAAGGAGGGEGGKGGGGVMGRGGDEELCSRSFPIS